MSDPAYVLPTIARALGLREEKSGSHQERLLRYLRNKNLLLLLDDFDRVIESGPTLTDLLTQNPQLKLMVTSREILRIRGEQEFAVPLLSFPDLERFKYATASLSPAISKYSAVELFLQQAGTHLTGFRPSDNDMLAIAEICVRLDGLPLALELAAARLKLFTPQSLLAQLRHSLPGTSFQLLTGGSRDLPARQRTLRNTIQWSYDLLNSDEQWLFRHLSVFSAGFTISTAETFAGHLQHSPPLITGITSLRDKSLIQLDQSANEPRLRMLEMLREYGREQLDQHGETFVAQQAHATTFLDLAEVAVSQSSNLDPAASFTTLNVEHENLRASLKWILQAGDGERASRLGVALWPYWVNQGHLSEGLHFLDQILSLTVKESGDSNAISEIGHRASTNIWAELLYGMGILAYRQHAWGEIQPYPYLSGSLRLYREIKDRRGEANALTALGRLAIRSGDFATSTRLANEALAIYRQLDDKKGIAVTLEGLGRLAMSRGEWEKAHRYVQESLAIYRSIDHQLGEADALLLIGNNEYFRNKLESARHYLHASNEKYQAIGNRYEILNVDVVLGMVMIYQGDLTAGRLLLQNTQPIAQKLGNERALMICYIGLGVIALKENQFKIANDLWQQGFLIAREHRLVRTFPDFLFGFAVIHAGQGEPEKAAQMLGAAEAIRHAYHFPLPPRLIADYEQVMLNIQNQLGESAVKAGWVLGPDLLTELVPEEFPADHGKRLEPAPVPAYGHLQEDLDEKPAIGVLDPLTPREREVLRLVAKGHTDNDVAEQLTISPRTVQGHLRSIYSKLGVNSRTAAARQALEDDLL